jgi:NADH-quinone oxidoreductase subunit J
MTAGALFFVACSLLCLVGAVWTILAQNPIRGAVGLLMTIVGIAGLFLKLNAQFLAAIQLIVYAGAVVVLFVFVIMLLGPDAGVGRAVAPRARFARAVGGVLLVAGFVAVCALFAALPTKATPFPAAAADHGSVEAVGGLLFSAGIVPFELATALLIIAVVGAIAVARGRPRVAPRPKGPMFHGPLHPRDAGRPLPQKGAP